MKTNLRFARTPSINRISSFPMFVYSSTNKEYVALNQLEMIHSTHAHTNKYTHIAENDTNYILYFDAALSKTLYSAYSYLSIQTKEYYCVLVCVGECAVR